MKTNLSPSKSTRSRYKKQGLDVMTDGKIDPEKCQTIYDEKREEQSARGLSPESKYWDEQYRKYRALRAEMELGISDGSLLLKSEVIGEIVKRETAIKKAVLASCRSLPPLLAGKSEGRMRTIIHDAYTKILEQHKAKF